MSIDFSKILGSPFTVIKNQIKEKKPKIKDCFSSKSTFYISIEELKEEKKRQNSLILKSSKNKEKSFKDLLRKKSSSLNQKKCIKVVKMKLDLHQYKNSKCINHSKVEDSFINNLNSSEISGTTTNDTTISFSKTSEPKEEKRENKTKENTYRKFDSVNIHMGKFHSSKQAGKIFSQQIKNLNQANNDNSKKNEQINSSKNATIKKKDSKKITSGENDYGRNYDFSLLRKEPPKIPILFSSSINLENKELFSLSNINYGELPQDRVPNVFYNHLMNMKEPNNDEKSLVKACSTKRNKGKLLTMIYFKPQGK